MLAALTIAGSDSGGGAGVQADLKTFAAYGLHGVCAVTAVTAQDTTGVRAVEPVSAGMVSAQIGAVLDDFDIRAIKIGMLVRTEIIESVCVSLERASEIPLVVDPVMVATSGHQLLDDAAVNLMRTQLLPQASLVTPNRYEAEVLARMEITSLADAKLATTRIRALGVAAVVITGGHFDGPDAVDLLDDDGTLFELRGRKLDSRCTHGTGCTFAAAVAAGLARRLPLVEAVQEAKRYIEGAIRHATPLGRGYGPVNHFWRNERQ